ncbi:MAG: hypothetical protein V4671_31105 [Armatimonadota bacterium]
MLNHCLMRAALLGAALPLLLALPSRALQKTSQQDRPLPAIPPPGAAAQAKPTAARDDTNWQSVPELIIAGRAVMRLRSRAGGLTPLERAYSLRQRLGPILTLPNLSAEDVTIVQANPGQTASIYIRERLLVTVDRNLALANNTSIEGLAATWARNLRNALPQVNVTVRMSDDLPTPLPRSTVPPPTKKTSAAGAKKG